MRQDWSEEELSPAVVRQIGWEVRDGNADPEQAKRLMQHFANLVNARKPIPQDLLQHFRDCFESYLTGGRCLEGSLGLSRAARGRPTAGEANDRRVFEVAAEVLRRRVQGATLEKAAGEVSAEHHLSETQVREYWRHNKHNAFTLLRLQRLETQTPWSMGELKQILKIFRLQLVTGDRKRDLREGRWLLVNLEGKPFAGKIEE